MQSYAVTVHSEALAFYENSPVRKERRDGQQRYVIDGEENNPSYVYLVQCSC